VPRELPHNDAVRAHAEAIVHVPPGFGTLFPYFFMRDAAAFVRFLLDGLGGVEIGRSVRPDGRIANAQVRLGTVTVMVSEATDRFPQMPASYYLYVEDADLAQARAIGAGAVEMVPVQDMPYGDRQGGVRDPHGNLWWLSQRLEAGSY
jgi:PhnB protein